jgi:hypothetical protein
MEESSASTRASNLEAVMSIEPEGEDDAVGVLKSVWNLKKFQAQRTCFTWENHCFDPCDLVALCYIKLSSAETQLALSLEV